MKNQNIEELKEKKINEVKLKSEMYNHDNELIEKIKEFDNE